MFKRASTTILTDASGNATVYIGSRLRGKLHCIVYRPGTLDTGADLTITTEQNPKFKPDLWTAPTGHPVLTKANLGTGISFLYPRALPTNANSATGPLGTIPTEFIPLVDDRIKVVVAQGGNALTGTIEAIYESDD